MDTTAERVGNWLASQGPDSDDKMLLWALRKVEEAGEPLDDLWPWAELAGFSGSEFEAVAQRVSA